MNVRFNNAVNDPRFKNVDHFGVATNGSEFGYFVDASKNYKRTIITAPTGTCAVYQDSNNVKEFYYVHTDYQGSWLAITNSNKAVTNRYSYDAWGRPRNVNDWTLKSVGITSALTNLNSFQPRFDRGYTGHEIMAGFGLINMNGRLYDPYLQRFLSPDPYVQAPNNSQSYNRYSYCMNNPLMYTDPTGYSWWSRNREKIAKIGGFVVAAAVGIAVGIATAGIGNVVIAGFMSGACAGFAGGFAGTALNGGTLDQCMFSACLGGWAGGATGVATAGLMAGIGYGVNSLDGVKVMSANMAGKGFTLGGFRLTSAGYIQIGNGASQLISGVSNGAVVGGATTGAISGLTSGGSYISSYNGIADNGGGFISNQSNFMSFMNYMAKNNSVEVSGFSLNNGSYYVNPWNGNTPMVSHGLPSQVPGQPGVNAQYHTHPNSSITSLADLRYSSENGIPVYSIGANGNMWMVDFQPKGGLVPSLGGFFDETSLMTLYSTKIQ